MPDRCLVVVHAPGPAWEPGLPLLQQVGIQEHRAHYAQQLGAGRLLMGGPFLDATGGGMMIFQPDMDEDALRAHALADPAVVAGLLQFDIRPWLIGLRAGGARPEAAGSGSGT